MKQANKPSFKVIWSSVMVLIYLCVSALLVFTPIFSNVDWVLRIAMAVLLFVYGLFRAYRVWKDL